MGRALHILIISMVILSMQSLHARESVFDRGIDRNPYIYKGEFITGVTAMHGSVNSSQSEVLLMLTDIDASGSYTSVKPYIGYTIGDNQVLGAKFGFSRVKGVVDSAIIDFGESNDLSFDIPYVNYSQDSYNYGVFFRSYAGLDRAGRIALFADLELSYNQSRSKFEMDMGSEPIHVKGDSWSVDLDFNPGVEIYVLSNVSASVSFGLGGLSYQSAVQYDKDGVLVGEMDDSKLSLKFNILAINIGINIHLWANE